MSPVAEDGDDKYTDRGQPGGENKTKKQRNRKGLTPTWGRRVGKKKGKKGQPSGSVVRRRREFAVVIAPVTSLACERTERSRSACIRSPLACSPYLALPPGSPTDWGPIEPMAACRPTPTVPKRQATGSRPKKKKPKKKGRKRGNVTGVTGVTGAERRREGKKRRKVKIFIFETSLFLHFLQRGKKKKKKKSNPDILGT